MPDLTLLIISNEFIMVGLQIVWLPGGNDI